MVRSVLASSAALRLEMLQLAAAVGPFGLETGFAAAAWHVEGFVGAVP